MHTASGQRWEGIPTALDDLFFPDVSLVTGVGAEALTFVTNGAPAHVLAFYIVEAISGYDEGMYWSLAEEPSRPVHCVNRILGSSILENVKRLRCENNYDHFLICGATMCWEVVAWKDWEIRPFPTEDAARAAVLTWRTAI